MITSEFYKKRKYTPLVLYQVDAQIEEGFLLALSGEVSTTPFKYVEPEVIFFDEQTPETYTFDNLPF